MAVVQASRRHLLQHRLAGLHGVAAVVTDGGGGGGLARALAVTHWRGGETESRVRLINLGRSERPRRCGRSTVLHLLFDSDSRAQSKQRHLSIHRCYLHHSAKATNCVHAVTAAKLPSEPQVSTHRLPMMSTITSAVEGRQQTVLNTM